MLNDLTTKKKKNVMWSDECVNELIVVIVSQYVCISSQFIS